MHIITIDRPSIYRTPSIWWKNFRYSILFRQSPENIYMCEPRDVGDTVQNANDFSYNEQKVPRERKKRIMPAFKWDGEKLKIYRCQKWRQAYKTKLTETDARTKKTHTHSLTHGEHQSRWNNVRMCVRPSARSPNQLHKFVENNFSFFRSLSICRHL